MFIGGAERSIVGSAAIYTGVTNTFLCLDKGMRQNTDYLDRIRRTENAVMSVQTDRERAVGYAA
jgi:hypothetical protein